MAKHLEGAKVCVGSGQTLDIIHEVAGTLVDAMALTPGSNSEADTVATRAVHSCPCLPQIVDVFSKIGDSVGVSIELMVFMCTVEISTAWPLLVRD